MITCARFFLLLAFVASSSAQALPGDEKWEPFYCLPGVNGPVYATASYGDNVYVGGQFTSAGGVPARNVARFDGRRWYSLGDGVTGVVRALAVDLEEPRRVYVGGELTEAGGTPVQNIALWDGTGWSSMAGGVSGPVFALEFFWGQNLYVGGAFESAGGGSAKNAARWNGSEWFALGSGVDGPVEAIAVESVTSVFFGGRFNGAGGVEAASLAKWDGTGWSEFVGGIHVENEGVRQSGVVRALDFDYERLKLVVGGQFNRAGDVEAANVAVWDTAWHPLGSGTSGGQGVYAVLFWYDNVLVGGTFDSAGGVSSRGAARWDNERQQFYPMTDNQDGPDQVRALGSFGYVVVGGSFSRAGGLEVSNVSLWVDWAREYVAMGQGVLGQVNALQVINDALIIGGSFDRVAGVLANNIANVGAYSFFWSGLGGGVNGPVHAVLRPGWWMFLGGEFTVGNVRNLVAGDGINWYLDAGGVNGPGSRVLAIAPGPEPDVYYVGGRFDSAGNLPAANIALWNDREDTWTALGAGVDGAVNAIWTDPGQVLVGGDFTQAGGETLNGLAKWNPSTSEWSRLGGATPRLREGPGVVWAIRRVGDHWYVAGQFDHIGTTPANSIARWNGAEWQALGDGVAGTVNALAYRAQDIYVGGDFATAGGNSARNVARWNGSTWTPLGSGTHGPVRALEFHFNTLFIGGAFQRAGAHPSLGLARWRAEQAPVLRLTSPADGAEFEINEPIPLSVEFSGFPETPTRIHYYASPEPSVDTTQPPFSGTFRFPAAGEYIIVPFAYDARGNSVAGSSNARVRIKAPAENRPPTIAITSPADGQTFRTGEQFSVTFDAHDPDGTVQAVELYLGRENLGNRMNVATEPPFTLNVVFQTRGSYELWARVIDDKGATAGSPNRVIVEVLDSNFPPQVFFENPFDGAYINASENIRLTVSASDRDGLVHRVEFLANDRLVGSAPGNAENRYEVDWVPPTTGDFLVRARALDLSGAPGVADLRVTVVPPGQNLGPKIIPGNSRRTDIPATSGGARCLLEREGILYLGGGDIFPDRRGLAALQMANGKVTPWDPDVAGTVNAVALYGAVIYAGGKFQSIGGQVRENIAAIDLEGNPTTWNPAIRGEVFVLKTVGAILYVGGVFDRVGATERGSAAAFDVATGELLPWDPKANGAVRDLAVADGRVYLGGDFSTVRGLPRSHLAAVDTTTGLPLNWEPAPDGPVLALQLRQGVLYIGGAFQKVSGQPRAHLAAIYTDTARPTGWRADANGAVQSLSWGEGVLYAAGSFTEIGGSPRGALAGLDIRLQTPNATSWSPSVSGGLRSVLFTDGTIFAGGDSEMAAYNLPLRFGTPRTETGQVVWDLKGPWSAEFTLESSSNLTDWTPLNQGTLPYVLKVSPQTARFYRFKPRQ